MKIIIGVIITLLILSGLYVWFFPIAALVTLFGNFEAINSSINGLIGFLFIALIIAFCILGAIWTAENLTPEDQMAGIVSCKTWISVIISCILILSALKIFTPKNGEMLLYAVGAQVIYQNEDAQKIAKSATGILSSAIKIVEVKAKQWETNITTPANLTTSIKALPQ